MQADRKCGQHATHTDIDAHVQTNIIISPSERVCLSVFLCVCVCGAYWIHAGIHRTKSHHTMHEYVYVCTTHQSHRAMPSTSVRSIDQAINQSITLATFGRPFIAKTPQPTHKPPTGTHPATRTYEHPIPRPTHMAACLCLPVPACIHTPLPACLPACVRQLCQASHHVNNYAERQRD